MVRADDHPDIAHEAADALEHALALDRVPPDDRPLVLVERSRLVDDLVGNRDLADVVQQRRELEVAPLPGARPSLSATLSASATTSLQCSPVYPSSAATTSPSTSAVPR